MTYTDRKGAKHWDLPVVQSNHIAALASLGNDGEDELTAKASARPDNS